MVIYRALYGDTGLYVRPYKMFLEKLETEKADIEKEIVLEGANYVNIDEPQVRTFLKAVRKGNKNDPMYRKTLINVLISKVYLYDDNFYCILYYSR